MMKTHAIYIGRGQVRSDKFSYLTVINICISDYLIFIYIHSLIR